MAENNSVGKESKAASRGLNRYDSVLILALLCVILSGFIWVVIFYTDKPDKDDIMSRRKVLQENTKSKPVRIVRNMVSSVNAVPLQNGSLKVTFNTLKPAMCEMAVGYNSLSPKYRKVSGYAHEMRHTLTARDLLPGQVYYVISGSLKDGAQFREPVRLSQIGAKAGTKTSASTGVASVLDGSPAETTDGLATEPVEGDLQSSIDTVVDDTLVQYDAPLPPASPDTVLGKRALSASTIHRTFGPDSLTSMKKAQLEKHIKWLHGEFEQYEDARGARELAEAYYEYKDYRKALRFATRGTKMDATDIESHGIRLKVYTKFAMGWKVKETQKKILELAHPEDRAALEKKFSVNEKRYGDYKTRGTPQVISVK